MNQRSDGVAPLVTRRGGRAAGRLGRPGARAASLAHPVLARFDSDRRDDLRRHRARARRLARPASACAGRNLLRVRRRRNREPRGPGDSGRARGARCSFRAWPSMESARREMRSCASSTPSRSIRSTAWNIFLPRRRAAEQRSSEGHALYSGACQRRRVGIALPTRPKPGADGRSACPCLSRPMGPRPAANAAAAPCAARSIRSRKSTSRRASGASTAIQARVARFTTTCPIRAGTSSACG